MTFQRLIRPGEEKDAGGPAQAGAFTALGPAGALLRGEGGFVLSTHPQSCPPCSVTRASSTPSSSTSASTPATPGLSGRQVLERLRSIDPEVKIAVFTGHTATAKEFADVPFLTKPLRNQTTIRTVQDLLNSRF